MLWCVPGLWAPSMRGGRSYSSRGWACLTFFLLADSSVRQTRPEAARYACWSSSEDDMVLFLSA